MYFEKGDFIERRERGQIHKQLKRLRENIAIAFPAFIHGISPHGC